jgi:DNA-binding transcriptional regulator YhcF (GntR family)
MDSASLADKDPVAETEQRILEWIRASDCRPHQKIVSERALAGSLKTSISHVHYALGKLRQKGHVYAWARKGWYVSEQGASLGGGAMAEEAQEVSRTHGAPPTLWSIAVPRLPSHKALAVAVPVGNDPVQVAMWQRLFAAFESDFPFLQVQADFDARPVSMDADVSLVSPAPVREEAEAIVPLDEAVMAKAGMVASNLCEGILELGRPVKGGDLLGVPVLRTTTMLAANRRLLAEHGLADEPVADAGDLFRLGARLEDNSLGSVLGVNYPGASHYAGLYGVDMWEKDGAVTFDRKWLATFLSQVKPFMRPHHFTLRAEGAWERFLDNRFGLFCWYSSVYPHMRDRVEGFALLRMPLGEGGFVPESATVGVVPKSSKRPDEAMLLLGFLASEKAQTLLTESAPHWLSVHAAVLRRQEQASPFPEGAIQFGYDRRCFFTQLNPRMYWEYNNKLNSESAKFFSGLQELEETLDRLAVL